MGLEIYAGQNRLPIGAYSYVQFLRKQLVIGLAVVLLDEIGPTCEAAAIMPLISGLFDCIPEWKNENCDGDPAMPPSAHASLQINGLLERTRGDPEFGTALDYHSVTRLRTNVVPSAHLPAPLREAAYGLLTWCDQSDCDAWLSPGTTIDAAIGLSFLREALAKRGFDGEVMESLVELERFFAQAAAKRLSVIFA